MVLASVENFLTPLSRVTLSQNWYLASAGSAHEDSWIPKAGEAACETQEMLAAQQEPKWSGRLGEAPLCRENTLSPSGGPRIQGQGTEPQACCAVRH